MGHIGYAENYPNYSPGVRKINLGKTVIFRRFGRMNL